jgi:hypothetical protein
MERNTSHCIPTVRLRWLARSPGNQTVEVVGTLIISAMVMIACFNSAQGILSNMVQALSGESQSHFVEEEPA